MTEWFYHLPVVWMSVVVFLATAVVTAALYGAVLPLATGERGRAFKAVSPVMLTPLAVVFGLIVGFLAAQVWVESGYQVMIISSSTIMRVSWCVVFVLAALGVLTLAFMLLVIRVAAAVTMATLAIEVTACIVLIAAHNRLFTGEMSVGPELLRQ